MTLSRWIALTVRHRGRPRQRHKVNENANRRPWAEPTLCACQHSHAEDDAVFKFTGAAERLIGLAPT
jgi:hypothetical protein